MTLSAAEARKVAGVDDAFDVRGRFDAVAYVSVDDNATLKRAILRIQAIKGVKRTETLIEL